MNLEALQTSRLTVSRGGAVVLDGIDLRMAPGETVCIVGRNGTGKSTLVRALSGLIPYSGTMTLGSRSLMGLSPADLVRLGVVQLSQSRRVFPHLTVAENLRIASESTGQRRSTSPAGALDVFPELRSWLKISAGNLSGGQQQVVAIGRAIELRPRFLLADEPSTGLATDMWPRLARALAAMANGGAGILLIEHRTRLTESASHTFELRSGKLVPVESECLATPG